MSTLELRPGQVSAGTLCGRARSVQLPVSQHRDATRGTPAGGNPKFAGSQNPAVAQLRRAASINPLDGQPICVAQTPTAVEAQAPPAAIAQTVPTDGSRLAVQS